jgi:hypothetical protein
MLTCSMFLMERWAEAGSAKYPARLCDFRGNCIRTKGHKDFLSLVLLKSYKLFMAYEVLMKQYQL